MFFERTIAVIGGGASGTLAAVHVLRRAPAGVRVVLIDRNGHGRGVAYSTRDPLHLLNVRASRMSAFEDDPGDLLRWCRARGIDAGAEDFLPRALFGDYLQALLVRFGDRSRLELVTVAATAVEPVPTRDLVRIELADGRRLIADAAVLALGNRAPAPLPAFGPLSPYVSDPWAPGALACAAEARRIVVVGSGLTAVDVAMTVTAMNPEIEVCAVSRHGWLPRAHRRAPRSVASVALPRDARGERPTLLSAISAAVNADPSTWPEIIDGLRPRTTEMWQQMSIDDRRLFVREFKAWWDVHRHRMAPAVADEIARLRRAGRLEIRAGRFQSAHAHGTGVRIEVREQAGMRRIDGDLLINATGPSSLVRGCPDPLVRGLLAAGHAQPDALGLGFACDIDGRLLGARSVSPAQLFTLGPPRRGELLESVAIPEIRAQADALSRVLVSHAPETPRQRISLVT